MRITVQIDESVLRDAEEASGGGLTPDQLVEAALKAYVERQAALALSKMGGTSPGARAPRRRR